MGDRLGDIFEGHIRGPQVHLFVGKTVEQEVYVVVLVIKRVVLICDDYS